MKDEVDVFEPVSPNDPVPSIISFPEPQLKSINNLSNSVVSKKLELQVNGVAWNILLIKYLIFIKGLKACCKEVSSG